jgi:hypothetical protein
VKRLFGNLIKKSNNDRWLKKWNVEKTKNYY